MFELKEHSELPLYQQIVEAILAAIQAGTLPSGARLPTVRDLAEEMQISRGTIMHAYNELESRGFIRMVQGRGTFVQGLEEGERTGKKERAMKAIDRMLDELDGLAFTPGDIRIFLDLKLREREAHYDGVHIAVVDCNPEALAVFADQIEELPHAQVRRYLLDEVRRAPETFDEEGVDLVATSTNHYDELLGLPGGEERLVRVALSPNHRTVADIAQLAPEAAVGTITASEKFAGIIHRTIASLHGAGRGAAHRFFHAESSIEAFLQGLDVVIVPSRYLGFCTPAEGDALRHFQANGGRLIRYTYQIDAGSYLMMDRLVAQALEQKRQATRRKEQQR